MNAKNELRAEVEIEGEPQVGARLRFHIQPPDGRGMTLKPRVTVVELGRAFGWLGTLGLPHIFDGAHRFELERIDGGRRTRVVQSERFRGIVLPLIRRSVLPATLRGFDAMNLALAKRVAARKVRTA